MRTNAEAYARQKPNAKTGGGQEGTTPAATACPGEDRRGQQPPTSSAGK